MSQKAVKKVYNLLYTLPYTLRFAISILHLHFTKNVMSGRNWVGIRLNIDYLYQAKQNKLVLMDLNYYVALKELKYAIYDGLEMKLKVTKMSVHGTITCPLYMW